MPHQINSTTINSNAPQSEEPQKNIIDTLLDREQRSVAELLTRFKNLVLLAAQPVQDAATKEVAALQALQMEIETSALVRATEDLLQLTRELKELWLFGPLRGVGEGEGDNKMDEDSKAVGEMLEALLKKQAEDSGS